MALYQKYRPKTFKGLLGNEESVEALSAMVRDDCPQVFLFHGPKGCGKTTVARILANELGVKGNDLREMDTADFRGIDVIREVRKQSGYRPLEGPYRMWILDEVHRLTNDAQSALLKILEDTPPHVFFVLATTDPQKLLPTVKSRCTQFELKPLSEKETRKLIARVSKREIGERLQKEVSKQIAQDSLGHPRDALQILDKVLRVDKEKRLQAAKREAEQQNQSIELCRALLEGAPWKKISRILNGLKDQEAESIRRHVLGYAQAVVLKQDNPQAGLIMEEFIEPFYDTGFAGVVYACYSVTKN